MIRTLSLNEHAFSEVSAITEILFWETLDDEPVEFFAEGEKVSFTHKEIALINRFFTFVEAIIFDEDNNGGCIKQTNGNVIKFVIEKK